MQRQSSREGALHASAASAEEGAARHSRRGSVAEMAERIAEAEGRAAAFGSFG